MRFSRFFLAIFFLFTFSAFAENVQLVEEEVVGTMNDPASYQLIKLQTRIKDLESRLADLTTQMEKIDGLLAEMVSRINTLEEGRPVEILSPDYNLGEFEYGFDMLAQNKLDIAFDSFSLFIKKYPNDLKVGDAYFWLGEVEYQRGNYENALENYLTVYKNYKVSSRRNDALLKMSLVLASLDKRQEACDGYIVLINHTPNLTPSLEQKARIEAINLGCLDAVKDSGL